MGRVRYARSARDLEESACAEPRAPEARVRSIRCVYETDAEVAAAVVPRPLEVGVRPDVHLSFQLVGCREAPGVSGAIDASTAAGDLMATIDSVTTGDAEANDEARPVCSASFGVRVEYDDKPGVYLLTRPSSSESEVVRCRERFGEPMKLAHLEHSFSGRGALGRGAGGEPVSASAERMGVRYLAATGRCVEALGPRTTTEYAYCFKAFPGSSDAERFDQDPQLVRLEWRHRFEQVWRLDGGIELWDSPFDPVSDLPVRRIASLEYAVGTTSLAARVLRPVPGEWLRPFLHQRYDVPRTEGLDV